MPIPAPPRPARFRIPAVLLAALPAYRDTVGSTGHDHVLRMKALDDACAAEPQRLAIDVLVDVLDANGTRADGQ